MFLCFLQLNFGLYNAATFELIFGSKLLVKVPQCRNINRVQALPFTIVNNRVFFWGNFGLLHASVQRTVFPKKKGPKVAIFQGKKFEKKIQKERKS
jgi:hypothetical protein